jgi:hypothetical protein
MRGAKMVIKTFNLDEEVYKKYAMVCKDAGISMSRQVTLFMRSQLEEEPKAREEFLERIEKTRQGRFIRVEDFGKRYGLKR